MHQINFLKTRSFWMIAGAVVTTVTGVPVPPEVVNTLATVLSGQEISPEAAGGTVDAIVPTLLAGMAYAERLKGKRKVVWGKERY